jgi:hypothetical protein
MNWLWEAETQMKEAFATAQEKINLKIKTIPLAYAETLKKWGINLSNMNSFAYGNTKPAHIFADLKEATDILRCKASSRTSIAAGSVYMSFVQTQVCPRCFWSVWRPSRPLSKVKHVCEYFSK